MRINNISIYDLSIGQLRGSVENAYRVKSLPCLSIVQATQGSYDIKIQDSPEYKLEETDAFVAPPNKTQYIRHHDSKLTGIMEAQWIFFNAVVNNEFYITDIYEFPVCLPREYNRQVMEIIGSLKDADFCMQHSKAFELLDILIKTGREKPLESNNYLMLKNYISNHICENDALAPSRLCALMNASPATFYRNFKKWFGVTSVEYIKNYRLDRAAFLLETTDYPIGDICDKTGFYDNSQLDLFFKNKYGVSPSNYRKSVKMGTKYTGAEE